MSPPSPRSMSASNTPMTLGNRKLVVLGIPWDIDTEGLRQYMSKYGELADVIVMKDRTTGRSRGFGYVTFMSSEDADKALATQHLLNGRMLEVKVATPKEDMRPPPGKKNTRVFIARIPASVSDEMFRSYFEKYGPITDAYMPKEQGSRAHRGIGFVTYENAESVDKLIAETHELGGSTIAVDRATPKEETGKSVDKSFPSVGLLNSYMNAARFGFFGMPPFFPFEFPGFPFPSDMGGAAMGNAPFGPGNMWQPHPQVSPGKVSGEGSSAGAAAANPTHNHTSHASAAPPAASKPVGKKIFVGRIPTEANSDDVRLYFSRYGRLLDVYLPKDRNKTTHRGFGFVTFAEESSAERVASCSHELLGQTLAIDRAAPIDESPSAAAFYNPSSSANSSGTAGVGGPMRGGSNSSASAFGYGSQSGGFDYANPWGSYSSAVTSMQASDPRASRMEPRYKPY